MGQQGYTSCGGCGRLFRDGSDAEMRVLSTHKCDWSDDRLNREIEDTIRRWARTA